MHRAINKGSCNKVLSCGNGVLLGINSRLNDLFEATSLLTLTLLIFQDLLHLNAICIFLLDSLLLSNPLLLLSFSLGSLFLNALLTLTLCSLLLDTLLTFKLHLTFLLFSSQSLSFLLLLALNLGKTLSHGLFLSLLSKALLLFKLLAPLLFLDHFLLSLLLFNASLAFFLFTAGTLLSLFLGSHRCLLLLTNELLLALTLSRLGSLLSLPALLCSRLFLTLPLKCRSLLLSLSLSSCSLLLSLTFSSRSLLLPLSLDRSSLLLPLSLSLSLSSHLLLTLQLVPFLLLLPGQLITLLSLALISTGCFLQVNLKARVHDLMKPLPDDTFSLMLLFDGHDPLNFPLPLLNGLLHPFIVALHLIDQGLIVVFLTHN